MKSFGYDAAGRTTGITYSGATTTLAYDYEGRVTSITRSGSTTNSFTYNGLNARMTRTDSNGSRTMLRDGADVLAPVIKDGSKEYAPGLYQWDSGNGSKPFVTDRLGSVTKITDWQGNSPASKSFDAFGVQQSGSTSDLFGFAGAWGYQSDADHGMQLLGHRVYDPDLGRFLTRDPIKDGRNWYGYCENNPTKFVDPEGLESILGIIRKAIANGQLPTGTARKYQDDPVFRSKIHRRLPKQEVGGRDNPELPEEVVIDVVDEVLEEERERKKSIVPVRQGVPVINWPAVRDGAVIVVVVIGGGYLIITSGGSAAPAVVSIGGAIITSTRGGGRKSGT